MAAAACVKCNFTVTLCLPLQPDSLLLCAVGDTDSIFESPSSRGDCLYYFTVNTKYIAGTSTYSSPYRYVLLPLVVVICTLSFRPRSPHAEEKKENEKKN